MLDAYIISCNPPATLGDGYDFPHFTDEKTGLEKVSDKAMK